MITPIDAIAVLAILWLMAQGRRLHGWWIAGLLLLVLGIIAAVVPDQRGLRARHFANAEFREPAEDTRVDRRIDFTPGANELPLYWIDNRTRDESAFSIQWEGYWWVETNGDVLGLYMDAPGATGAIVIDGVKVLAMGPTDMTAAASVEPLRGWHQLIITVSAPPTATRRVSAGQLIANERFPFDRITLGQRRIAPSQRVMLRAMDYAGSAFRIGVVGWLGVLVLLALVNVRTEYLAASGIASRRGVTTLFAFAAIAEALWFAWPWASRLMQVGGGDDTLTYARHLQPYFLAGLHFVFGETMFGPMLVQRLLVACVAWALMDIAVRISRADVWPTALTVGVIFAYSKVGPISATLLNEALFVPLLAAWTIVLLGIAAAQSSKATRAPLMWAMLTGLALIVPFVALRPSIVEPAGFAASIGRKALFAFGYYESYVPGFGMSAVFLLVSMTSLIGLRQVFKDRGVPLGIALLPALVAASQFVAVMLVDPKSEGLLLPFQTMLAAYAAVGIAHIVRRF